MLSLQAACGCEIGNMRSNNEDNFLFADIILKQDNSGLGQVLTLERSLCKPIYFGVFDGMGGEAFGEEASYLAAETMLQYTKTSSDYSGDLNDVIQEANQRICLATRNHNIEIMGSTVVLLKISKDGATILNLGDSKAFLFRENHLEQMSIDHTDRAILEHYGIQNRKPRLTQHLGVEPSEMIIEPSTATIDVQIEDQLLICSDGLTDMVSIEMISEILLHNMSPEVSVSLLIKEALLRGGRDNITVILCKVVG